MVDNPQTALGLIDGLAPQLDGYHLFHATCANLLRRMGASEESAQSYAQALVLVTNDSERRFRKRRMGGSFVTHN
jgi:RNA polymerase sigma-70 factor (ECF subfamily)